MQKIPASHKLLAAVMVIVLVGGVAWWQRTPMLTWYYLRELSAADADSRERWAERVATLDAAVVPGLLSKLEQPDPTFCINAEAGLVALVKRWGPEDGRTHELADQLRQRFAGLSPIGQIGALQVMTALLRQDGPATWPVPLTRAAGEILQATPERPELRNAALMLAGVLLDRAPQGQWLDPCRILAEKGLGDKTARTRSAAVQLAARPALQADHSLLGKVAPLLRDRSPVVRRAALVAVAPANEVVSEEDLIPLLHDDDAEVQRLCEAVLRSRGLSEEHLELARLISDSSPKARLRVLERLGRAQDLDPAAWLRRLSQDPSPAVRAAAVRAAAGYPKVDLSDRLREMANSDPSETVRQNAQHYLQVTAIGARGD